MTIPSSVGARLITPGEAMVRARRGDAVLLDVREEHEYAAGHAPDAAWLPLDRIRHGAVPHGGTRRPVLCVCRSGGRSAQAAQLLARRGLEALSVSGGMQAWAQEGLPVRDARGGRGRIA